MEGLIVEPSRTYQKLLSTAIESGGIGTRQVSCGSEALNLLKKQSFDLVFIAMHLPDMDGPMFSSQLRANDRTRQIPLVMITSNEDKKLLDEAFSAGVTEIFAKHELEKITHYIAQLSRKKYRNIMTGNLLCLENNSSMNSQSASILRESGYTVDHFNTPEDGLAALLQNDYDLVLTDILLKGKLNGFGLIKAIRNLDQKSKDIPLLVFSVLDDTVHKIELLRLGASDYITKPLIQEELLARVHHLVSRKKLQDKLKTLQHQMHELTMRDQLTGLYNRLFLMETAPTRLREAARHQISCSLMIMELDQLKSINVEHGHTAGDRVLKIIASVMTTFLREEDIAAYYESNKFVVLLPHCNIKAAACKAEKIRRAVESLESFDTKLTASFGIAELHQNSEAVYTELFNAANEAVLLAKSNGRNQVISNPT